MERWQVLSVLSAFTVAAAVLVPRLQADDAAPAARSAAADPVAAPARPALPAALPAATEPPAPTSVNPDTLHLRAGLDRGVVSGDDAERYLVFELVADEAVGEVRAPVDISFVVDVSGSMSGEGKIDFARLAARELVSQLDERDRFSLVTFDDRALVEVAPGPVVDRAALNATIDRMFRGGGTNVQRGLDTGLAQLHGSDHSGTRRVVLLSDGQDSSDIGQLAAGASASLERGITVSALGVGLGFDEQKLVAMAKAGGGRFHFVQDARDLPAMIQEELDLAGSVAARGARLELSMADGAQLLEVYGYDGYSGGATPEGWSAFLGDIYSGQTRKFVARVRVPDGAEVQDVARFSLRFTDGEQGTVEEAALTVQAARGRPADAAASADPTLGAHAARAVAGVALKEADDFWRRGDLAASKAAAETRLRELETLGRICGQDLVEAPMQTLRSRITSQASVTRGSRTARAMEANEALRALGYIE